jgi:hypothetical protein
MTDKRVIQRARRDQRQGKSPTTQAGEFVREEFHHIREGKHGTRSTKQAIAIGHSKARRAGVELPPPEKGRTSRRTRRSADQAFRRGQGEPPEREPSAKRSRATLHALQQERKSAASRASLSKQAQQSAGERTAAQRSAAAHRAVTTKGPAKRHAAAIKAARTRRNVGRRSKAAGKVS